LVCRHMLHITSTMFIAGRSCAGKIEDRILNAFLHVVFSTRIITVPFIL